MDKNRKRIVFILPYLLFVAMGIVGIDIVRKDRYLNLIPHNYNSLRVDMVKFSDENSYEFSFKSRGFKDYRLLSTGEIFIDDQLISVDKDEVVKILESLRSVGLFKVSDEVLEWKATVLKPKSFIVHAQTLSSNPNATVFSLMVNGELMYHFCGSVSVYDLEGDTAEHRILSKSALIICKKEKGVTLK